MALRELLCWGWWGLAGLWPPQCLLIFPERDIWARAGMCIPKSCGFQPACEMQIVWSAGARTKLRAITGKCGHMAVYSYTPRLALALWHWGTLPTAPSQLGAEHSHSTCISPGLCPLMSCGSALNLCHGLCRAGRQAVNLGPEKGDEGGVHPVLRGLQAAWPPQLVMEPWPTWQPSQNPAPLPLGLLCKTS